MTGLRWVASDVHRLHDPKHEIWAGVVKPHVETPARAEAIRAALEAQAGWALVAPVEHGLQPIEAVHDSGLVAYLATAWEEWTAVRPDVVELVPDTVLHPALREGMGALPSQTALEGLLGQWCFETMTPIMAGTYHAAREAVDVALTAADLVLDGGGRLAYGLCRPPGHHAPRAAFGGYCYFNNAAIAAESLARRTGGRVAILDLDVHHGNGTQQIFYTRPDVLYVSLHGDPARMYPYFTGFASEIGASAGVGTNVNLPLPAGCGDLGYASALAVALERIRAFDPAALVVSLGLDTYELDPLGDLGLTPSSYNEAGSRVGELGLPTVVLQEGGYHVPDLGRNAVTWLRGLVGMERPPGVGSEAR